MGLFLAPTGALYVTMHYSKASSHFFNVPTFMPVYIGFEHLYQFIKIMSIYAIYLMYAIYPARARVPLSGATHTLDRF